MIKIWTFFFQVLLLAHLLQVSTGLKLLYIILKNYVFGSVILSDFICLNFLVMKYEYSVKLFPYGEWLRVTDFIEICVKYSPFLNVN